ncbi:contact-dependent growth inhibition system immunity protein [Kitasatospora sp. NPDC057904]|uniref:contact-dependent growth inhibition system immunity protein n=1 Tax=Kitasatospora sp. NPDC057904 TaxID=3346275 RepID=UPI0036DACF62
MAHLLPLAWEVLRDDPMAEGDMYAGDLLNTVLTRSPTFWSELPGLAQELGAIVSESSDLPPDLMQKATGFLSR